MKGRLGLSVERRTIHATVMAGGRVAWAARAEYSGLDDLADAVARLGAERPGGISRVRIALAGSVSQIRVVDGLPSLSRTELVNMVRIAPRQFFLQNGARLIVDAEPQRTSLRGRAGSALMAAAEEPLVEALVTALSAGGLTIEAIAPSSAWLLRGCTDALAATAQLDGGGTDYLGACAAAASAPPVISLLPTSLRQRHSLQERRAVRSWATAFLIATSLAAISYFSALARQGRNAEAEFARLGGSLARVQRLQKDLDQSERALAFLNTGAGRRTRNVQMLAGIARALPDSAFITSVRVDGQGRWTISGLGPSAGSVVAGLERAPGVLRAKHEGSVTREVLGSREYDRFTIALSTRAQR